MTSDRPLGTKSSKTEAEWSFLTKHGRVLLSVAHEPSSRLRDIAQLVGVTERRVHGILNDLVESGYVTKTKHGRRNRYEIVWHLPVPDVTHRMQAIGEVLTLLSGVDHSSITPTPEAS